MLQILRLDALRWFNEFSKLDEGLCIKSYNEKRDEGYFFDVDVQYPEQIA